MEVKEELVKLGTTQWHNLNKCGLEHQYLPGTGTMYQHQDVSVENKGGRVDLAVCKELHNKKLSKSKQV
jgi:hypothetical protein